MTKEVLQRASLFCKFECPGNGRKGFGMSAPLALYGIEAVQHRFKLLQDVHMPTDPFDLEDLRPLKQFKWLLQDEQKLVFAKWLKQAIPFHSRSVPASHHSGQPRRDRRAAERAAELRMRCSLLWLPSEGPVVEEGQEPEKCPRASDSRVETGDARQVLQTLGAVAPLDIGAQGTRAACLGGDRPREIHDACNIVAPSAERLAGEGDGGMHYGVRASVEAGSDPCLRSHCCKSLRANALSPSVIDCIKRSRFFGR